MAFRLPLPSSQLWLLQGNCTQKWTTLTRKIVDHPLNHALEVFVPRSSALPDDMLPTPERAYYTAHLALSHMIQADIIDTYITPGHVSALSVERRVDLDNVFALLPSGKLILSLDKDTYEQLGLQGKPSRYCKNNRFVVELDLTAPHFRPGKPNYERVQWCVTDRLNMEADFVLTFTGSDDSKFVHDFNATRKDCHMDTQTLTSFPLPTLQPEHPHGLIEHGQLCSCPVLELHTWLGVVAHNGLKSFYEKSLDNYVSTFRPPEPHSECQNGIKTRWTGMVSSTAISHVLEKLRGYLSVADEPRPAWVTVSVWGFEDAPVSWGTNEHGCGDNHYTIVLFRTGHFWLLTTLGPQDIL